MKCTLYNFALSYKPELFFFKLDKQEHVMLCWFMLVATCFCKYASRKSKNEVFRSTLPSNKEYFLLDIKFGTLYFVVCCKCGV